MTDCACSSARTDTLAQRRVLRIALVLNAMMFIVETGAGLVTHSTGLIADGIDMLADASTYAITLTAVRQGARFKANAAMTSGTILLLLGLGVLAEVGRRYFGAEQPEGPIMIAVGLVALMVNAAVLRMLGKQNRDDVHIRATWIFTRADVVANAAVIVSGLTVLLTGNRYFDLLVGLGIGLFVIREALEILGDAGRARKLTG
ncbi:cation diffusion facilitator family transporter [Novosphingobium huizhouense]|uniref:cation diffusion facilitator family transporter n=1 Tax=Novosphingobium huizhouense TaxID=2866625 RepID=UPI001CD8B938|nr:cation diffusion facilitator family transporter [Novosphingobium huizhouense]